MKTNHSIDNICTQNDNKLNSKNQDLIKLNYCNSKSKFNFLQYMNKEHNRITLSNSPISKEVKKSSSNKIRLKNGNKFININHINLESPYSTKNNSSKKINQLNISNINNKNNSNNSPSIKNNINSINTKNINPNNNNINNLNNNINNCNINTKYYSIPDNTPPSSKKSSDEHISSNFFNKDVFNHVNFITTKNEIANTNIFTNPKDYTALKLEIYNNVYNIFNSQFNEYKGLGIKFTFKMIILSLFKAFDLLSHELQNFNNITNIIKPFYNAEINTKETNESTNSQNENKKLLNEIDKLKGEIKRKNDLIKTYQEKIVNKESLIFQKTKTIEGLEKKITINNENFTKQLSLLQTQNSSMDDFIKNVNTDMDQLKEKEMKLMKIIYLVHKKKGVSIEELLKTDVDKEINEIEIRETQESKVTHTIKDIQETTYGLKESKTHEVQDNKRVKHLNKDNNLKYKSQDLTDPDLTFYFPDKMIVKTKKRNSIVPYLDFKKLEPFEYEKSFLLDNIDDELLDFNNRKICTDFYVDNNSKSNKPKISYQKKLSDDTLNFDEDIILSSSRFELKEDNM